MQVTPSLLRAAAEAYNERNSKSQYRVRGVSYDVQDVINQRQNVGPKRLGAPGPNAAQLEQLVLAAAAAPDHGRLTPWRFVLIPEDKRGLLAEAFAAALIERDPRADEIQLAQAREKAFRAPLLLLAVARLKPSEPLVPAQERLVALGCAIQNLLLTAQAMGYGSGLASGQAMRSAALRKLFSLVPDEEPVCFVNVGTVLSSRAPRERPQLTDVLGSL